MMKNIFYFFETCLLSGHETWFLKTHFFENCLNYAYECVVFSRKSLKRAHSKCSESPYTRWTASKEFQFWRLAKKTKKRFLHKFSDGSWNSFFFKNFRWFWGSLTWHPLRCPKWHIGGGGACSLPYDVWRASFTHSDRLEWPTPVPTGWILSRFLKLHPRIEGFRGSGK